MQSLPCLHFCSCRADHMTYGYFNIRYCYPAFWYFIILVFKLRLLGLSQLLTNISQIRVLIDAIYTSRNVFPSSSTRMSLNPHSGSAILRGSYCHMYWTFSPCESTAVIMHSAFRCSWWFHFFLIIPANTLCSQLQACYSRLSHCC